MLYPQSCDAWHAILLHTSNHRSLESTFNQTIPKQALLRQFRAFRGDVKAHNTRPQQLREMADQLIRDGYYDAAGVDARTKSIESEYEAIMIALGNRKAKLEENLALQV